MMGVRMKDIQFPVSHAMSISIGYTSNKALEALPPIRTRFVNFDVTFFFFIYIYIYKIFHARVSRRGKRLSNSRRLGEDEIMRVVAFRVSTCTDVCRYDRMYAQYP